MFPIRTLKELFGQDIAISQEMIVAIEKWAAMYRGQAPWVDDQVDSLQIISIHKALASLDQYAGYC